MTTKIARDTIESYLNCKYKGHLKLAGECGPQSDYEAMTTAARASSWQQAIARLVARCGEGDACRGTTVTAATLKQGAPLLADADLEDESLSLRFDALMRVDGASKLGDHHYVPVLHNHGDKVGRRQKLLLAVLGLVLSRVQGLRPAVGLVARGPEARLGKVRLDPKLYRQAEQVLGRVEAAPGRRRASTADAQQALPRLRVPAEVPQQAEQADDISLLGGVGEKELQRYNRKGIFTLTQLSCTFRPRKRGKRVKRTGHARYASLQALAIREKKVHVYGTPELDRKPVQVFLDAEGNEDGSFAYLLGVLVVEGDSPEDALLLGGLAGPRSPGIRRLPGPAGRPRGLCPVPLRQLRKEAAEADEEGGQEEGAVDRALAKAVNVLSAIHASVYFPTFSNGLKDVAGYLGCTWTEENASGLQSLVWRARWEQERDPIWKDKLLTYNAEDCAALKKVTEFVQAVGEAARSRGDGAKAAQTGPVVAWAVWWTPLSRPKNCIPSVQYRVWIQFHIPTPSGPPCPRRSCSHRRPFTGAEGLRCEQERLSRIANAASAPVHFPGRPPLQRLVRSFLVVEREVPTQTPLQLGHDLVAVQVHVLVLHRPP